MMLEVCFDSDPEIWVLRMDKLEPAPATPTTSE
jgi:hypothetical protein